MNLKPIQTRTQVGAQVAEPADQLRSPYLTSAEAIAYLRVGSESALYRLVREHRLPNLRRGRLYLFDIREIDAWLRGHGSALEMGRAFGRKAL